MTLGLLDHYLDNIRITILYKGQPIIKVHHGLWDRIAMARLFFQEDCRDLFCNNVA